MHIHARNGNNMYGCVAKSSQHFFWLLHACNGFDASVAARSREAKDVFGNKYAFAVVFNVDDV